jgi:cellobiose phosphorylase
LDYNLYYYYVSGTVLLTAVLLFMILYRMRNNGRIAMRGTSLSAEVLEVHAQALAREHSVSTGPIRPVWPLTGMNDSYERILLACRELNEDVMQKKSVPPAAEWLLDNFYLVEEQVKIVRRDLTKKEYAGLPVLKRGELRGNARILVIAMELVAHTDGQIEIGTLLKYLEAYQSHTVLLEREISILPVMIKLALVENIRILSEKIRETKRQWSFADEAFEHWISEDETDRAKAIRLFRNNVNAGGEMDPSFVEHLFYRLRRSGRSYAEILNLIDENLERFSTSAETIARKEHNVQAVYTVSMGNCIASLKYVSGLNWPELFENISYLEKILRKDPDGTYGQMDINSRNRYKWQIGRLAGSFRVSELHIAKAAMELASNASSELDEKRKHVGYYLTGSGLAQLVSEQKGELRPVERIRTRLTEVLGHLYLFFIISVTLILTGLWAAFAAVAAGADEIIYAVAAGATVLIPSSEIAVAVANFLACKVKKPAFIPRLELKDGIPEDLSTMVVMPAILSDLKTVEHLLENIESHYLANREENLFFAILGALRDADGPSRQNDTDVIRAAVEGVRALNSRYAEDGKELFYFFNRLRKFNESDGKWTGWERKRGALMEFNELLLGSQETSFIIHSSSRLPDREIRYVITLDADTMLPFGTAKKLIGTMAHPMNRPVIDPVRGIVTEGYGVMQPRISFDIDSANKSVFSRILTGQEGIDPYSCATSDVYQDLFGEGIFTGKGIYDLKVFHAVLKDAIPENAVLSHDLLEGSYARTALVTDLELVDSYPSRYNAYMARLHRWIRGDWQLIPWLRRTVCNGKQERIDNPLTAVSKWKIADNLRRSLTAPAQLTLLLAGFLILPGSGYFWMGYVLLVMALPLLLNFAEQLRSRLKYNRVKRYQPGFFGMKSSLFQFLLSVAFLPYQAVRTMDAVLVTLYRVLVSGKNMLEWVTSADVEKTQSGSMKSYLRSMGPCAAFGLLLPVLAWDIKTGSVIGGSVFFVIWSIAPFLAYRISIDDSGRIEAPNREQAAELFRLARRTWRYFEEFSNARNNDLIPDNYQEEPPRGIAYRTSPTNIGLGLLASLSGRDLGFIGLKEMADCISRTITTVEKMEKWNGHLYNWYDTRTLEPLRPHYVSTVDSGNFVCYLITLAEGLKKYDNEPLVDSVFSLGIRATLQNGLGEGDALPDAMDCLEFMDRRGPVDLIQWNRVLDDMIRFMAAEKLKNPVWKMKTERMLRAFKEELDSFTPWVSLTGSMPQILFCEELKEEMNCLLDLLRANPGLSDLIEHRKRILQQIDTITRCSVKVKGIDLHEGFEWLNQVIASLLASDDFCRDFTERYQRLIQRIESLSVGISFKPLYNEGRDLFSIGYNADEKKLTNSYYDLLASEARQASYIAIARGEIPPKHWFVLGRLLTMVDRYQGLVSWSGTMFEYLMPLLLMKSFRNTLLDETYFFVLKSQQKYGRARNMPWGASESSFHSLDVNLDYQYKAIGVPWLGLKRGLVEDAVTSPYSTFMALMVSFRDAFENIKLLQKEGLEGPYGFYEAADYTPERTNFQARKVIIKSFMAHHEGMTLLALNNLLNQNIMQRRFSADPEVRAARLLLQEKIPVNILFTKENKEKIAAPKAKIYRDRGAIRKYSAPDPELPRVHILSNGNYSVMITDKGTGCSRIKTADISRWREDPVDDRYGMFFYIRNITENRCWSAAYAPLNEPPERYEIVFTPDKAVFERMDGDVETIMEIAAASDDNVEIRKLQLKNNGESACMLEVTSYFELVLASGNSDQAHPAFSSLFIRTEYDPEHQVLLACRRPRSQEDKEIWMAELPVICGDLVDDIQYETDRMQFLGRGHSVRNPLILERDRPLSNTVGAVLDPIISLRVRLNIEQDETAQIYFVTLTAASRETVMDMVARYCSQEACDSAFWLALTRSQVETKYLNIKARDMELYQDMISDILYISPQKQKYAQIIRENKKGQPSLWAYGISGDHPIILAVIEKARDTDILFELLRAHEYWRIKDLKIDLVVLSHEESSYSNPLYSMLSDIVCAGQSCDAPERHRDVFLLNAGTMLPDEIPLLYAAARMVFRGSVGSMREQTKYVRRSEIRKANGFGTPRLVPNLKPDWPSEHGTADMPGSDGQMQFYNGLGGFEKEGTEYVIRLDGDRTTPAPWINVIANPEFGFIVSESGGGYTWCGNSRENKLTPWSNDPVCDTPGEIFYCADEERDLWSITPLPVRETGTYLIRHGFGYTEFEHESHGIRQNLVQFVPVKGTVKISILTVKNNRDRKADLRVTYYIHPVLGVNARDTAMHLASELSPEGILTVQNPYNREFPDRICYVATSCDECSVTGDRKEFFGAGNISSPDALKEKELSGRTGAGLEPCAAMQVRLCLEPGEERQLVFLLGMEGQLERIREQAERYRDIDAAKADLDEVGGFWRETLQTIRVSTPDPAMDLLLNGWLLYQAIACRMWARTAFYQAGGAYGFRDQLQDSLAVLAVSPKLARDQILLHAQHQFLQGDVLHWWHEPAGKGTRTRFSDDYLWLPFVTVEYIKVTEDQGILEEQIPFLDDEPLREHEDERYSQPRATEEKASLYDHCIRSIERGLRFGEHGLPLIGGGDWNDGMNTIGNGGKGESVWLAWFLCSVMEKFIQICRHMGDGERADRYVAVTEKLVEAAERNAWDGNWYRRAFFDNGAPLGSVSCKECKIDSLAQSWAVISGKGDPVRTKKALDSIDDYLVMRDAGLIKLLTPPFDEGELEPGYIKGYVPGVRENGGQYTHAAAWVIIAFAMTGNGDKAAELFHLINPVNHTRTDREYSVYRTEPYVMAADVYSVPPHTGRGGWTWYTGTASWMYKAGLESILGFQKRGNRLEIDPCIPGKWAEYSLEYHCQNAVYLIQVKNPGHVCRGVSRVIADGEIQKENSINLIDDGKTHSVEVILG